MCDMTYLFFFFHLGTCGVRHSFLSFSCSNLPFRDICEHSPSCLISVFLFSFYLHRLFPFYPWRSLLTHYLYMPCTSQSGPLYLHPPLFLILISSLISTLSSFCLHVPYNTFFPLPLCRSGLEQHLSLLAASSIFTHCAAQVHETHLHLDNIS